MTPQYKLVTEHGKHRVVVIAKDGRELDVTHGTPNEELAKGWLSNLRRAASIEAERKRQAQGLT